MRRLAFRSRRLRQSFSSARPQFSRRTRTLFQADFKQQAAYSLQTHSQRWLTQQNASEDEPEEAAASWRGKRKRTAEAPVDTVEEEDEEYSSEEDEFIAPIQPPQMGPWAKMKAYLPFRKKPMDADKEKDKKQKAFDASKLSMTRGSKVPADAGVMTHIPRHKAMILHILQSECDIFPDEAFAIFPDPKTETVLAKAELDSGAAVHFDDGVSHFSLESTTGRVSHYLEPASGDEHEEDEDKAIESGQKETKLIDGTEKRVALAKIETKTVAMRTTSDGVTRFSDVPTPDSLVPSATRRRAMKASMVDWSQRGLERDLDPHVPFKETLVLTPDEVTLLYKDQDFRRKTQSATEGASEGLPPAWRASHRGRKEHALWTVNADDVYEMIAYFTELGFKSNQTADVWPYNEFGMDSGIGAGSDWHLDEELLEEDLREGNSKKGESGNSESDSSDDEEGDEGKGKGKKKKEEEFYLEKSVSSEALDEKKGSSKELAKKSGEDESSGAVVEATDGGLQKLSGLQPTADRFNDFYLFFSRFPEVLGMELNDFRRKVHTLEQFEVEDIRSVLLKDPRILRRPAHHLRKVLELFDDFHVENAAEVIAHCPHMAASTSRKELQRRLHFVDNWLLKPKMQVSAKHKYALGHVDKAARFGSSNSNIHKKKPQNWSLREESGIQSTFEYSQTEAEWDSAIDKERKRGIAEFVGEHPSVVGNATANNMRAIVTKLKSQLRVRGAELQRLLEDYPEIVTVSPKSFDAVVRKWKRQGVRHCGSHLLANVTEMLTYAGTDACVRRDFDYAVFKPESKPQRTQQYLT